MQEHTTEQVYSVRDLSKVPRFMFKLRQNQIGRSIFKVVQGKVALGEVRICQKLAAGFILVFVASFLLMAFGVYRLPGIVILIAPQIFCCAVLVVVFAGVGKEVFRLDPLEEKDYEDFAVILAIIGACLHDEDSFSYKSGDAWWKAFPTEEIFTAAIAERGRALAFQILGREEAPNVLYRSPALNAREKLILKSLTDACNEGLGIGPTRAEIFDRVKKELNR